MNNLGKQISGIEGACRCYFLFVLVTESKNVRKRMFRDFNPQKGGGVVCIAHKYPDGSWQSIRDPTLVITPFASTDLILLICST